MRKESPILNTSRIEGKEKRQCVANYTVCIRSKMTLNHQMLESTAIAVEAL
jgi:hypothetical protein